MKETGSQVTIAMDRPAGIFLSSNLTLTWEDFVMFSIFVNCQKGIVWTWLLLLTLIFPGITSSEFVIEIGKPDITKQEPAGHDITCR